MRADQMVADTCKRAGFPLNEEQEILLAGSLAVIIEKAVNEEREECAKVCDRFQARDVGMQPAECAGAIRARGQA